MEVLITNLNGEIRTICVDLENWLVFDLLKRTKDAYKLFTNDDDIVLVDQNDYKIDRKDSSLRLSEIILDMTSLLHLYVISIETYERWSESRLMCTYNKRTESWVHNVSYHPRHEQFVFALESSSTERTFKIVVYNVSDKFEQIKQFPIKNNARVAFQCTQQKLLCYDLYARIVGNSMNAYFAVLNIKSNEPSDWCMEFESNCQMVLPRTMPSMPIVSLTLAENHFVVTMQQANSVAFLDTVLVYSLQNCEHMYTLCDIHRKSVALSSFNNILAIFQGDGILETYELSSGDKKCSVETGVMKGKIMFGLFDDSLRLISHVKKHFAISTYEQNLLHTTRLESTYDFIYPLVTLTESHCAAIGLSFSYGVGKTTSVLFNPVDNKEIAFFPCYSPPSFSRSCKKAVCLSQDENNQQVMLCYSSE